MSNDAEVKKHRERCYNLEKLVSDLCRVLKRHITRNATDSNQLETPRCVLAPHKRALLQRLLAYSKKHEKLEPD